MTWAHCRGGLSACTAALVSPGLRVGSKGDTFFMSVPSFPNVDPPIQREDAVNQILSSIAMEELGAEPHPQRRGREAAIYFGHHSGSQRPSSLR